MQTQGSDTHHHCTRLPLCVIAQIVESANDLQERVHSALPDAFIVVGEKLNQLERAWLDIGEEVALRSSEQRSNGVCSNLLLNSDGTVDIHQLVEIKILELHAGHPILSVIGDGDSVLG